MTQCEQCISLNQFPGSDVEIAGEQMKEVPACPFFPDGIPQEIQDGSKECEFKIVD